MTDLNDVLTNGTVLTIPVTGDPISTQRLTLDGRVYTLGLAWNEYAASWHLTLSDAQEDLLVAGIRIVANLPLLRWYQSDARLPPGELLAQDLTGDGSPPGLDDFGIGKRVELTYYAQTQ